MSGKRSKAIRGKVLESFQGEVYSSDGKMTPKAKKAYRGKKTDWKSRNK